MVTFWKLVWTLQSSETTEKDICNLSERMGIVNDATPIGYFLGCFLFLLHELKSPGGKPFALAAEYPVDCYEQYRDCDWTISRIRHVLVGQRNAAEEDHRN